MKMTYSENAWDFKFAKILCSEFCMFYSIQGQPIKREHVQWQDIQGQHERVQIDGSRVYCCLRVDLITCGTDEAM